MKLVLFRLVVNLYFLSFWMICLWESEQMTRILTGSESSLKTKLIRILHFLGTNC